MGYPRRHASEAAGDGKIGKYPANTLRTFMARRLPFSENLSFAKQIKSLADNELLDIWEETQRLEQVMFAEWNTVLELAPEYERLIVLELQYRMSMRGTEQNPLE